MKLGYLVVAAVLGLGSVARAEVQYVPPEPPPPAGPKITIMWAPIRLIVPLGEITAEYRVMPKLGVSIELGGGKRTLSTDNNTDVKGTELEAGAQVRYYAIGTFRKGMEVGAEILDEYVKFNNLPANVVGAAAGGVTVGPFIGYKIATHLGFTFEIQGGARYLIVDPPVSGQGSTSMFITSRWEPLAHINIGWSF